jgi:hypothetical protein
MWKAALVLVAVLAAPAAAQDLQSMKLSNELGTVLGSEEACGLTFDRTAIERFIETRVKANDMGFANLLNSMTRGTRIQIKEMSEAHKAAHCAQTRRVARTNGFVK